MKSLLAGLVAMFAMLVYVPNVGAQCTNGSCGIVPSYYVPQPQIIYYPQQVIYPSVIVNPVPKEVDNAWPIEIKDPPVLPIKPPSATVGFGFGFGGGLGFGFGTDSSVVVKSIKEAGQGFGFDKRVQVQPLHSTDVRTAIVVH